MGDAVLEGSERTGARADQAPAQHRIENPATGSTLATVPVLRTGEIAELARRGRRAQTAWREAGFGVRTRVFRRAQAWLYARRREVADTIIRETGKTAEDAALEVAVAMQAFGFWARHGPRYLAEERVPGRSPILLGRRVAVRYEPLGLVGVIGPWNYPLVNGFCDCVPALIAGNAVLHKPSEVTPLTAQVAARMLSECGLPADVFNVATGGGETGAAVVDEADFVMFTGSTRTGRRVMERAARTMTPVSLELGGKDPMIVLADANLERAANGAVYYSMNNGGQVCISVERVYVEEPVYERFIELVLERVSKLRQGVPGPPGTTEIGAITFAPQLDKIAEHVADALAKGARLLAGGEPAPGPGRFFQPTVLADVDHSMKCMTEETFGPMLPIMKVRDAEQAIELANDSRYGLQASVWTGDRKRGERIARRIEAGAVLVNDAQINFMAMGAPMGGWKESGIGSRHGANGIRKYCRTQTVVVNRFPLKRDMHMFPYGERAARASDRLLGLLYGRRRW